MTFLKEATIHIVDGKVDDIHFDGQEGLGIDAFLLVTHRRNVEEGHFLAFGNSDRVGKMLYNFYLNCLRNDYVELGETLEKVAGDILDVARIARSRPFRQLTDRVGSPPFPLGSWSWGKPELWTKAFVHWAKGSSSHWPCLETLSL